MPKNNKHKIKYLMNDNITVELFVKNDKQYIYIASDNASGCEYEVKTFDDIGNYVADYVEFYMNEEE